MAPTRRTILRRVSATGALGLLAGCTDGGLGGGYGPGGSDATDTPTATESTTPAPTSTTPAETTATEPPDPMGEETTTTEGSTNTAERTTEASTTEAPTATETSTTEAPTATPEPGQPTTVRLQGFAFDPIRASVDPGDTVRWVNEDAAGHDVTSARFHDAAESWDFSTELSGGASVSYTFDSPGVYEYACTIHGRSSMCGVILVGDASLSNALPCESGGDGDDDGNGGGDGGYGGGDGGYRFG